MEFVAKVVKQGNSLAIRIPSAIAKNIGVSEGDFIKVNIAKATFYDTINPVIVTLRKDKAMRSFSDDELTFCLLAYRAETRARDKESIQTLLKYMFNDDFLTKYKKFKKALAKVNWKRINKEIGKLLMA